MIDPESVAFDIDGVFADTMQLFIDILKDEYGINSIGYGDITCYELNKCINLRSDIVEAAIDKIQKGNYRPKLKPFNGAKKVLTRIGNDGGRILFVTARPYLGPIQNWIHQNLCINPEFIKIITTGSFDGKIEVLLDHNVSYFVEDRLETCFLLKEAGITPILFVQPWNREKHPFLEVNSWTELESFVRFK
ncbi:MAG: haloacid dehalogenase [Desulfobacterales bacterium]|nr:haloacid dehalogenase [Desulfobacterales bacterium]